MLGLQYAGDPDWFYRLTPEDRVRVKAAIRASTKQKRGPGEPGMRWFGSL